MDNTINGICIKNSCQIIYIKTWEQKIREIIFSDYYDFKEKNSIGREIGDIIIQTNSSLLEELKEDIVNGDGTIDEIAEVKSITFYDSWNEIILLEVLAENIEFVYRQHELCQDLFQHVSHFFLSCISLAFPKTSIYNKSVIENI